MSCEPCPWARSRSWCTSWKSRVARAVETTRVGVTGSSQGGSSVPVRASSGRSSARPPRSAGWSPRRAGRSRRRHGVADGEVLGRSRHRRDHPHPLLELDERDRQRQLASGHLRRVVHQEGEDRAAAGRHDVPPVEGVALRTARPGRVPQRAARVALLDPQLARGCALPEELGVLVAHRAGDQRPVQPPVERSSDRGRGLNFSTRNDIVATSSRSAPSPTHQLFSVVTK